MVVPLFGWSAGDIVVSIKILRQVGAAFKNTDGAKDQYAEAASWLELFASQLEHIKTYIEANPNARFTSDVAKQIVVIGNAYDKLEKYLRKYEKGLSSHETSNTVTASVKKVKWAVKELKGEVDKLKSSTAAPILQINLLFHLQEL